MKKLLFAFVAGLVLTSCATVQSPVFGLLYQDVKSPVAITGNSGSSKVGTSKASTILGLVAIGDASVEAAAKAAGITKIHHVDQCSTSILSLYGTYTVTVYGE